MPVTKFCGYSDEQIDINIVPCPHGAYSLIGEMIIKFLKKKYYKLVNATQKRWLLAGS